MPKDFWEKCKTPAIPIKTVHRIGIFPTEAIKQHKEWVKTYGKDIMVVIIPDDEAGGYSASPILIGDLNNDPNQLLEESLKLIGKDDTLSNMKRICAMLLLGWTDTK